jgi:UDP-N-acetyl-D-glucosamine dehydrogenase
LSILLGAVEEISKFIKPDTLIIIESTVEPGTTRNTLLPIVERISKLSSSQFNLAFSPERIDPTNKNWNVANTPKLVSGLTESCAEKAMSFYSLFINTLTKCNSLEIAETAKLLENSFRLVNISFINEISAICSKLGIDVQLVIEAASTKPYGFMPFFPSIGVGGHCIPVDPIYLSEKARNLGTPSRMIELASNINDQMPNYFMGRAKEKIGSLRDKQILVVGVAYKPNVSDVRETPVEALLAGLKTQGAKVFWHDDLVKDWNGEKSVALSNKYDLAILATPHDYLDLTKLGDVPILNTRGSI